MAGRKPGNDVDEKCENLQPTHQEQDNQNDDDETKAAATIVASAVKRSAADAAEPAKKRDDKNNENDRSNRHRISPPARQWAPCSAFSRKNEWEPVKFHC